MRRKGMRCVVLLSAEHSQLTSELFYSATTAGSLLMDKINIDTILHNLYFLPQQSVFD
jgi:hypothetical protein